MPKDDATAGFGTFGLPNSYFGGVAGNFAQQKVNYSDYTLHNESRDIYYDRYQGILVPAAQVDTIVNQNLSDINTRKDQIQALGDSGVWSNNPQTYSTPELARAAINPLYYDAYTSNDNEACSVLGVSTVPGGFVGAVGSGVSQPAGITSTGPVGMAASGIISINNSGTLVIEQVSGTFVPLVPLFINGVSSPAPTSVSYTGMTKLRADCVIVTKYGAMEPPDSDETNPYANDSYPLLDGSTDGVGSAQTFFKNAIDTGDGGNPTIGDAANYGKVYTFDTSTTNNDSLIASKLTEIDTLRTTAESNTNSGFVLKQEKTSYAITVWSYDRGNKTVEQYISGLDNMNQILDNL